MTDCYTGLDGQPHATRHTPGPWHVGGKQNIIYAADGYAVAIATTYHGKHGDYSQFRVNARLIAAAPDLLAACELAEKLLSHHHKTAPDSGSRRGRNWGSAQTMFLRTAIKKATK